MKTLVLGGTGFVGRRLVEVLAADGARVTVLNRGVTPVEPPPGVARLVADRSDATSVRAALAGTEWDAVFDVSGVAKVAGGTDPGDLADLLAGRVGRYVYVSSQSLYQMTGASKSDAPCCFPTTVWWSAPTGTSMTCAARCSSWPRIRPRSARSST